MEESTGSSRTDVRLAEGAMIPPLPLLFFHQVRPDSDPLSDAEFELQCGRGAPQGRRRRSPGRPGRSRRVRLTKTTQAPCLDDALFTLARYPPT